MAVLELLSHDDAVILADMLVCGGVAEFAQPGESFRFRGGWESPVKWQYHLGFNTPRLRNLMFERLMNSNVREILAVRPNVSFENVVCLGVPNGGVPWASVLADKLGCEFRLTTKREELAETIMTVEGLSKNAKYFIAEDMTTKGGSTKKLFDAAQKAGGACIGWLTLGEYGFREADHTMDEMDVDRFVLIPWKAKETAMERHFPEWAIGRVKTWHQDPGNWKP